MKSRPSRLPEQIRSTSAAVSVSPSLATTASAIVAANRRWSLASTRRPAALSVCATTPLPLNASIAGPGGRVANSSASRGARRCLEPMKRIRGYDTAPTLPEGGGGPLGARSASQPTSTEPPDRAGCTTAVSLPPGGHAWPPGRNPVAPDGTVPSGWEAQTRLVFEKVGAALAAAGARWGDVVKLTLFVVDVTELATVRTVRDQFV